MKHCSYCGVSVRKGEGTYVDVPHPRDKHQKRLVHKKCEEDAKKLLKNKENGYYVFIMGRTPPYPKKMKKREKKNDSIRNNIFNQDYLKGV